MKCSFVRDKKASARSRANTVTESVRSKPQLALNILNYMLVSGMGVWRRGILVLTQLHPLCREEMRRQRETGDLEQSLRQCLVRNLKENVTVYNKG